MVYERIEAGSIQPGDRVARARSHRFNTVKAVSLGQIAVRIAYVEHNGTDRPNQRARWWREVPA